jgi:hypothetical protein
VTTAGSTWRNPLIPLPCSILAARPESWALHRDAAVRTIEEVAHYLSSSCGAAGAASRTTTATEPSVGASAALRTELSRWLTELADEVSRRRFGNDRVVVHLGLIICSSNLPMLCYM